MSAEELNGPVKCVGYLNKCEPWKLHSRFFPSKVGGKPAWLDLSNLPSDINCKNCDGSSRQDDGSARFLLPEFELQTEEDADESVDVEEGAGGDDDEDRRLSEYEQLLRRGCGGTFQGDSSVDADLLRLATPPEDRAFVAYAARVKDDPEQVLRYERGGAPLWVSDHHAAQSQDVPPCPLCAAPRSFEFQIFSVLLNHLGLDAVGRSVDWGTLAVYTCRDSCGQGPTYKEEFLCKQDFAAQPSSL
ncbi:programmed cell death protein 2 isoform X1 [Bacillus rossius redtenbacheri]|uniref:programmed cell death protein 2 isoform X1 n=1 Tax=Bacillus rossius redtenbacheri TaxID=93214 RepID=UPI002FDE499F